MRILLVALNARYVHTNLAIRYLREVLKEEGQGDWQVGIKEFSINEQLDNIASEIYEEKPDIIGFSCYIWNISQTISLVRQLRPVLPETFIIVGGPEVSFDAEDLLGRVPQVDAVVAGEGECSLPELVRAYSSGRLPWDIAGIVWRLPEQSNGIPRQACVLPGQTGFNLDIPEGFAGKVLPAGYDLIVVNQQAAPLRDLNALPNPYAEEEDLNGRLAYVETSRGCPFNCKFCISSTFRGVRYLETEKFRLILRKLFEYGASTVKFVDRTFNANKKHAFRILSIFREEAERYMLSKDKGTPGALKKSGFREVPRAHCELAGELLDEEWLEFLQDYPEGMIQLEIGVQSTHQPTLEAINRPQSFSSWQDKVIYLQHECGIPVHLDLIAGLPYEGWSEFSRSFCQVYEVRPDNLQLGFLKVLKGSGIWEKSRELGLVYSPDPPYSILRTRALSHDQILALRRIEEILEKYYNSGRFRYTLECVMGSQENAFSFYHSFSEYWHKRGWFRREWKRKDLFFNLWQYLTNAGGEEQSGEKTLPALEQLQTYKEALRFDYYLQERPGQVPDFLLGDYEGMPADEIRIKAETVRKDPVWEEIIPEAKVMDRRQWARATAVEYFAFDVPDQIKKGMPGLAIHTHGRSDNHTQDRAVKREGVWYLFYYTGKDVRFYRYNASL